ncbi:hypothetical protein BACFIN_08627 [Bacteroides finegoldii DSM 17565]|nr:hypothetical protein BACFIN_08627 [Bacteroides finegoldii DSM 17565]
MHKVYLKPGKEESLKRFHPWIFSGAISRFDGEPEEGEVVEVYTSKKRIYSRRTLPNRKYRCTCAFFSTGTYQSRFLEA